jgi:hypothetical protein
MSMDEAQVSSCKKKRREVRLSAQEVRGLYYMKERYVEDILETAVTLDEQERKLALKMLRAIADHRRSLLS